MRWRRPSPATRCREVFARYERAAVSPGAVQAMMRMVYEVDLRDVLPMIRVPTLVLHRADAQRIHLESGRYLAEHIPDARFVEIPGIDSFMWAGEQEMIVDEIEEFLTGVDRNRCPTACWPRSCSPTSSARPNGPPRSATGAGGSCSTHTTRSCARTSIARRGRVIETKGDGFVATFDGPARAVLCARDIVPRRPAARHRGAGGLHTGEIELIGDDIGGIAVHIAARVMASAGAGEVLVSSTVKDLVVGSGLVFEDRGTRR